MQVHLSHTYTHTHVLTWAHPVAYTAPRKQISNAHRKCISLSHGCLKTTLEHTQAHKNKCSKMVSSTSQMPSQTKPFQSHDRLIPICSVCACAQMMETGRYASEHFLYSGVLVYITCLIIVRLTWGALAMQLHCGVVWCGTHVCVCVCT